MNKDNEYVEWSIDDLLEVFLEEPDDFLRVAETLTRIGVPSGETLWQSCNILHKQGRYFIVHFKEMFCLDGQPSRLTQEDLRRRNRIAMLLAEWNLCSLAKLMERGDCIPMNKIKIVPFKQKEQWQLKTKYKIGNRK